jgi:hypothetical protein
MLLTLLTLLTLLELLTLDTLELVEVQTAPFTVGFSAAPPFLLAWKPKATDCPGAMLPFQESALAV